MRDQDVVARAAELLRGAVECGVELDRTDHCDCAAGFEVLFDSGEEMWDVDLDVDEDVEGLDFGHVDGDQAAVGVVDQDVAAEGARGVVVYAAGAVGHVAHDERAGARAELSEDVRDSGGEEE